VEVATLSSDLTTITTEVKTYQQVGGQAIFEIGRRVKWVKEHDLAHGEFGSWLDSIGLNDRTARRFMKIAEELPESATSPKLSTEALYLIATLPEDERDKEQQLDSGESKTPDEMTVRELRETKRKLEESTRQVTDLFAENQQLKAREPEKVRVPVEVKPDDYEDLKATAAQQAKDIEYMKRRNQNLQDTIQDLSSARGKYEQDSKEYKELTTRMNELRGQVNRLDAKKTAAVDMINLKGEISEMLDQIAPDLYAIDFAEFRYDDPAMQTLRSAVDKVERWTKDMRRAMPDDIKDAIING
jgi:DNA repair exonuclease SbcCD ATPase subunit